MGERQSARLMINLTKVKIVRIEVKRLEMWRLGEFGEGRGKVRKKVAKRASSRRIEKS
jgi:hypothetical protein